MEQQSESAGLALRASLSAVPRGAVLPVALFAWFAATAWLRPLAIPDEGRYVGVALEMLWSGNWLVPTLDTLPYFHKPPLFYWLTAASLGTFGINVWAARLAPLIAATGCAYAVYLFVRRWVSEDRANAALLVLATTPFFYGGAQYANLDMLVAACISATILCAVHSVLAAEGDGRLPRRSLAGAYAFAALGVLAKGLIGIAIPAMVIVLWLLIVRRPGMILRLVWLPGLALFSAIAAPWFALMQARYPGFFEYFFVRHHFQRFVTQEFNNQQPFWFMFAAFAGVTLPWCALLVGGMRRRAQVPDVGVPRQVEALMWVWLVSTLIFFSIPRSKLIGYVLVAVPPFAVLVMEALARVGGSQAGERRLGLRMATVGVALCAVALGGALMLDRDHTPRLAAELRPLMSSPKDAVLVLRGYPFSLPFYLRHAPPLHVAEEWDQPWILQKDSWRRELFEAAEFNAQPARGVLLKPAEAARFLACARQTVWVIGRPNIAQAWLPQLPELERVAEVAGDTIWRKRPSAAAGARADCGP